MTSTQSKSLAPGAQHSCRACHQTLHRRHQRTQPCRSLASDLTDGFLDVSKLLSGSAKVKTSYEKLAGMIGRDVYVDVNGWHLHLQHIKAKDNFNMAQALAQAIGPEVKAGVSDADLEEFLKKVPLQVGQGKGQISLYEAIPKSGVRNLSNAIKDFKYEEER